MPPLPKRKRQYKDQPRDAEDKYLLKRVCNYTWDGNYFAKNVIRNT